MVKSDTGISDEGVTRESNSVGLKVSVLSAHKSPRLHPQPACYSLPSVRRKSPKSAQMSPETAVLVKKLCAAHRNERPLRMRAFTEDRLRSERPLSCAAAVCYTATLPRLLSDAEGLPFAIKPVLISI